MNIAIVGYGRMGRMVMESARGMGIGVSSVIDPFSDDKEVTGRSLSDIPLSRVDAVIDFSASESVLENIEYYASSGIAAVIGTTGWYDRLDAIKGKLDLEKCSIIYSGNFSIGVAILLKSASYLSRLMNRVSSYDVAISESHHRMKADSPSGTALMLADAVLGNIERKSRVVYGAPEGRIGDDELEISSLRVGSVAGIHSLIFDSSCDTIELKHTARSRSGFAEGAIRAAIWLQGRKGFFSMDDFINDFLGEVENGV